MKDEVEIRAPDLTAMNQQTVQVQDQLEPKAMLVLRT